jgi:hypothetical protein
VNSLKKINIENLFSTETSVPHTNGKLDINTLFASKVRKDFVVDPKILLDGGIKRKKTLEECYINIYKTCWDTIVQADKSGITDIIFEVPEPVNCLGYSSTECLTIIEKNLMAVSNNGIKCTPLNDKRLFITWFGIENVISAH